MKKIIGYLYLSLLLTMAAVAVSGCDSNHLEAVCGKLKVKIETTPGKGGWISLLSVSDSISANVPLPLFEVSLKENRESSDTVYQVRSDQGWSKVAVRGKGKHKVISFTGLDIPGGEMLSLSVGVTLTGKELTFTWSGSTIPDNLRLESATLLPLTFKALPSDVKFFYPYSSGILCDPEKVPVSKHMRYPSGFGASMGWFALYDGKGGLYLGAHDRNATFKYVSCNNDPGERLDMRFDYPATIPDGGEPSFAPCEIVLAPLDGDWFDAAMKYRSWVRAESAWYPRDKMGPDGRTDTPLWMKELCVWAIGNDTGMKDFQKAFGVPVGIHWYNWHSIPFDNDYPHYFPAKEGFKEKVKDLQASGIYVMPYINGRLWDTHDNGTKDSLFTSLALPAVTKKEDGTPNLESYGSFEADGSEVKLGVMCPETETWRNKLGEIVLRLCNPTDTEGFGVNAVYMDQIAAAPPALCYDPQHSHPRGGGDWWVSAYDTLVRRIRDRKPSEVALTTESNADGYAGLFDGFLVWQFQHDGQIPAFGAVYGGTIQLFGRNYGGDPDKLASKMKLAQSFVWGEQLGWIGTLVVQDTELLPYMQKLVELRYRFRDYFYKGEMARPPKLLGDNPVFDTEWVFNGKRLPVSNPAILCGAWVKEGKIIVLFANYSPETVTLEVSYPFKDWGLDVGQVSIKRHDIEGKVSPVDGIPDKMIFHPEEVFVLEME